MTIWTRSRKTNIITAYVLAALSLFFLRQLSSDLRPIAGEPAADALIFISDADSIDAGRGSNSVYRIGLDGLGLKRVVGSIPHGDGYLRVSDIDCEPVSQQLVIASHRHDLNGFHHAMLDGSGLHLDRPAAGDSLSATRQIALAPDGVGIIVSRQFDGFAPPRFGLVAGDLMSREYRVIRAPKAGRSYLSPDWSPDGRQIAYIIEERTGDSRPAYRLAIAEPDGGGERVLFETTLALSDVAFSPAGAWLALVMERQIYRIDRKGSDMSKLTDHLGGASSPRWSPDGERISYVSPSSFLGQNQLYVMNADGSGKRRVANIRGDVVNGCWARVDAAPSV